ncbi:MAG: hypothetical protein ACOVOV_01965, partial [Dolichospermum sp.]
MNRTGQTLTLGSDILFDATYLGSTSGGRLTLTAGVVDASSRTLTFITGNTPLARTSGTLTTSNTTSLIFGTTGNLGGNSFTIPASFFTTSPTVNNFTINRNNSLALSQGLEVQGALTLTSGALAIGAGNLLNLNGASLTTTSGTLTGSSTSDLIVTGTTGGTVTIPNAITLRTVTISGTRTLALNGTNDLALNGALTIASAATFDNGGESQITNPNSTASIVINGRFITRDAQGFNGSSTAIVESITPILNSGSTVEYGLAGTQIITTGMNYLNLRISGSGTKTPSNATTISDTLFITGSAILDASNNTVGGTNTNITMTGNSRFIVGGSGTRPAANGTYSLANTSTIEFTGASAKSIRQITYGNIDVSGSAVSAPASGLTLQIGSTFTVTSTGTLFVTSINGLY